VSRRKRWIAAGIGIIVFILMVYMIDRMNTNDKPRTTTFPSTNDELRMVP
jgi:uncharacterized membrane-anchored protein YhcB (DUF1043 family)